MAIQDHLPDQTSFSFSSRIDAFVIIYRYLHKEVLTSLLAITALLLFIFLSDQFVRYIGDAVEGKLPLVIVMKILVIATPLLIGVLLPLGFFIGVLLCYGRLYVESEMVVMQTCGISRSQIVKVTFLQAIIVALVVSFLSFWANPRLTASTERLEDGGLDASLLIQTVFPGRFRAFDGGNQVYYVGGVNHGDEQMNDIFIAQRNPDAKTADKDSLSAKLIMSDPLQPDLRSWEVLSAAKGRLFIDPKTGDEFIVASEGYGYQGVPGTQAFRFIQYDELGVRIQSRPYTPDRKKWEELTTTEVWHSLDSDPAAAAAELQLRISMPLSVLILALLAIPLSKGNPRHGKYGPLLPAILVYIIYSNMIFVAKSWVEKGMVPVSIGVWWLHALVLLCGLLLLGYQARWRPIRVLFGKTKPVAQA